MLYGKKMYWAVFAIVSLVFLTACGGGGGKDDNTADLWDTEGPLAELQGEWVSPSNCSDVVETDYFNNGSSSETVKFSGNSLFFEETTFDNQNCSGNIFDKITFVSRVTIGTSFTSEDNEQVSQITTEIVDVVVQFFDQRLINDNSSILLENCGFVPRAGQVIKESSCSGLPKEDRHIGEIRLGIYQVDENTLYINGGSEGSGFPTSLYKSWFIDKYERVIN